MNPLKIAALVILVLFLPIMAIALGVVVANALAPLP